MGSVYKYRANLFDKENGFRQDTEYIKDGEFFASPLKWLNDPFEASIDLPVAKKDEHWVTPLIQKISKAGIYSLAKPKKDELFPKDELMWAHYANSHQGFCIEYDLERLSQGSFVKGFDIDDTIHVGYEDDNPRITENDSYDTVQTKTFGTKSKSWEKENEVRMVFKTNGIKPIADGAIRAIYFGLRMDLNERQEIVNILSQQNIKFFQINRIGISYKLSAIELDTSFKYEIVSTRHNGRVENYTILYKSDCKDKNTMTKFIHQLRESYIKPTNFTIIDDIRVNKILEKPSGAMTDSEIELLTEHWVALSTFDAPEYVWMYPEKWNK